MSNEKKLSVSVLIAFLTIIFTFGLMYSVSYPPVLPGDSVILIDDTGTEKGGYTDIQDAIEDIPIGETGWSVEVRFGNHGPIDVGGKETTVYSNPINPGALLQISGDPAIFLEEGTINGFEITDGLDGRSGKGVYTIWGWKNQLLNNVITGNDKGIRFDYGDDSLIKGNDITDNKLGVVVDFSWDDLYVLNNFHNNEEIGFYQDKFYQDVGPYYENSVGQQLHFNSFEGNESAAIKNRWVPAERYGKYKSSDFSKDHSTMIDATLNWWGGPDGPTANFDRLGDAEYVGGGGTVLGDVAISPWLAVDPDSDPNKVGVQLKSPLTFVVDDVGPEPGEISGGLIEDYSKLLPFSSSNIVDLKVDAGYLNRAIFASNLIAGRDTIEVRASDEPYVASEPIIDPVLIQGSGSNEKVVKGTLRVLKDADNTTITNIRFSESPVGVAIKGASDAKITNNTVGALKSNTTNWGTSSRETEETFSSSVEISNNTFLGQTEDGKGVGITYGAYLLGGSDHTVKNNDFGEAKWYHAPTASAIYIGLTGDVQLAGAENSSIKIAYQPTAGVIAVPETGTSTSFPVYTSNVDITGNQILGPGPDSNPTNDFGIRLNQGTRETDINYNVISGWDTGIFAHESEAEIFMLPKIYNEAHFNSITGNEYGVYNEYESADGPDKTFDATLNWWGDPSGPKHQTENPDGTGDEVSDNVIFSPWLGINPDSDPNTMGVQLLQLDYPMTFMVDDAGPVPDAGYLNTAVSAANELPGSDTIEVYNGEYETSSDQPVTESVTIVSCMGCPTNASIEGELSIESSEVTVGDRDTNTTEGFNVNADVTISSDVDASEVSINWNNIYGKVTNNGDNELDATYNWWGDDNPDDSTVGDVDYDPYLPDTVCSVLDYMEENELEDPEAAVAAMSCEQGSPSEQASCELTTMGLDTDQAEQLIDEYGMGRALNAKDNATTSGEFTQLLGGYSLPAGAAGGLTNNVVAGGAGSVGDRDVGAEFSRGETIEVSFPLADFEGEPATNLTPTVSLVLLDEEGNKKGLEEVTASTYEEDEAAYVATFDTTGLQPGHYEVHIDLEDGSALSQVIQIKEA